MSFFKPLMGLPLVPGFNSPKNPPKAAKLDPVLTSKFLAAVAQNGNNTFHQAQSSLLGTAVSVRAMGDLAYQREVEACYADDDV